jgi:hypothetical protein
MSLPLKAIYIFIFEPSLKHGACSAKEEENRLFLIAVGPGMMILPQTDLCSIQV